MSRIIKHRFTKKTLFRAKGNVSLIKAIKMAIQVGANLEYADLSHKYLKDFDLSNTNLANINLKNARLLNMDLVNSNLSKANFTGAVLNNVDLTLANLKGAIFKGAVLTNVKLANSFLIDVDLTQTTMKNCDF